MRAPAIGRCLNGHSRKKVCTRRQMPTRPSGSKHQEQDHDHAEGRVVHGEQQPGVACARRAARSRRRLDDVGKERHEHGAEQRAEQRAHAADDDHGDVLDRQEQRERLDRHEAAVVGEQRAGDAPSSPSEMTKARSL